MSGESAVVELEAGMVMLPLDPDPEYLWKISNEYYTKLSIA